MTSLPWWGDALAAIAAVLVALGTIWRYVWPAIRGLWRIAHGTAKLVEDFRETGGFGGLARQNTQLAVDMAAVKKELYPNGGGSLRDSVMRTESGLGRIVEQTERLEGYATESREGIADLGRRVTDLGEQVDDQSQRITDHRRRNEETARDLREFIEREHRDTLDANEHLRAALNEVLSFDEETGG